MKFAEITEKQELPLSDDAKMRWRMGISDLYLVGISGAKYKVFRDTHIRKQYENIFHYIEVPKNERPR